VQLRFGDDRLLELGRRTVVMGILNVTPDSFSDGGRHCELPAALEAAGRMVHEGAELIDVGGESTRPGARPTDPAEEARRAVPVVEAIKRELDVRVSIDTRRAEVAERAFDAGADMLNDVSALADPGMAELVRRRGVPVVLMHMRGEPSTMQDDTAYGDVVRDVVEFLTAAVERARHAGIADDKIVVDPGIGFGKSAEGNLSLLRRLPALAEIGPVLIGASRKRFIGAVLELPVEERLEGSLAVAAFAAAQGAHIIRAHDVAATVRAVRMIDAIRNA
jgi:dihydropteroate synthase